MDFELEQSVLPSWLNDIIIFQLASLYHKRHTLF